MKANRFLSFGSLLLVPLVLIVMAGSAIAQITLPAPTADKTFGRLSWYGNVTNFGGQTSFGVFGQANDRTNGFGFGVFGNGGINGTYGGGFLSVINGTNKNVGMWGLGANATGGTAANRLNVGLEVGANQFGVSGLYGWAIQVDSGDVELGGSGGPNNTTYVHNLVIDGSVNGIIGANQFTQNTTAGTVNTAASTAAALVALNGATNTDPTILAVDSSNSGVVILGNQTNGAGLMQLQNNGTNVFTVAGTGDVAVGANTFTVNAGSGQTKITDGTTTGGAALNVNNTAGTTGDAVSVTGSNNVGFTSDLTNAGQTNFAALTFDVSGNPITAGPGGAAVGITHGLYVDSLRDNQYVDFTGAKIVGISGENDYTQTTAGAAVATTSATTAALVANITDPANTDPDILLNNASTAGVVIQANQTAGANLVQLQKSSVDVFDVNGNGKTTITDATTTGASSFNVNNTAGTTGAAVSVTASNTTGFTSSLTDAGGTNFLALTTVSTGDVPATGGAAVGITHGLYVDSLRDDKYVDFTGATVIGISGNNQYLQPTTGASVSTSSSTAATLVALSGTANTDPDLVVADSGSGTAVVANVTGTGSLVELQKSGTDVFSVNGNGKTTVTDATTTGAATFNVNNTAGTNGDAVSVTGSNNVGFTSTLTDAGQTNFLALSFDVSGNPITAGPGGAAVGITHGLYVDSLRDNKYVDFTGATVVGISGANQYTQNTTGGAVNTGASTAASVVGLTGKTNTDPSFLGVDSSTTTGTVFEGNVTGTADLMHLQNNGTDAVVVANGGNTTITTTTGTALSSTTASTTSTDAAVKASGNGVSGGGALQAAALQIDNGAVRVTGANQPAGVSASITILAGFRTQTQAISNALAQANSYIVVTAVSNGGDTYSATVTTQAAGSFSVKVTDVEGNVLVNTPVTVNYWIVNQ